MSQRLRGSGSRRESERGVVHRRQPSPESRQRFLPRFDVQFLVRRVLVFVADADVGSWDVYTQGADICER
jgi:hypothetical protein